MWTFKTGFRFFSFVFIFLLCLNSVVSKEGHLEFEDQANVEQSLGEETHLEDVVNYVSEAEVEDETTKLANDLFKAAMAMLNSSNSDKDLAWDTMKKSAEVGSKKAQAKIAFAKLLGSYFDQASYCWNVKHKTTLSSCQYF